MVFHVFVVLGICLPFATSNSWDFREIFNVDLDRLLQNNTCKLTGTDSRRFYYKTGEYFLDVPDKCEGVEFSNYTYFPKCCPPGQNYEAKRHRCLVNNNESGIFDQIEYNLLVKSYLTCSVIIDHKIEENSINIYNSGAVIFNQNLYSLEEYCLDFDGMQNSKILRTCENSDVCKEEKCMRKCCKDGFSYVGKKCLRKPEFGISVESNGRFEDRTDDFTGIIQGKKCRRFKDKTGYNFTIKPDGRLLIEHVGEWLEFSFEEAKYCLEYEHNTANPSAGEYFVFICSFENKDGKYVDNKIFVMRICNIVSCVALFLTIVGYLFLKELNNLLGKIIVCYCGCLLFFVSLLTYIQFKPYDIIMCVPGGFSIAFFRLAAFAWMNVLSFEIWQALGSMSTQFGTQAYNKSKKFVYYHLYAWSIPILLLVLTVTTYYLEKVPESVKPIIGKQKCLIEGTNYGYHIFYAVPSLLYIITNLILYIKTIRYIFQVKDDIRNITTPNFSERQKRFQIDKERVSIVVRIFIIMGLSWLFEFIEIFEIHPQNVFLEKILIVVDIFNSLQGFLIFYVFMAKKKIFVAIKQKFLHRRIVQRNSTSESVVTSSMLK